MRLFIGIPMAAEVAAELAAVRSRLERAGDGLRWSAPEGWHITLQFLGETKPATYERVVSRLREVTAMPVPVELEGLGFFERAGVFFAGVRVTAELAELHGRVLSAMKECGFEPEAREYHPHITLARNRGRENGVRGLKPRVGAAPRFSSFTAKEFVLYESFPEAAGSRYVVRERFGLGGTS